MAVRLPRHGLRTRILLSILLSVLIAVIPVLVFLFSYGGSLTTENLYDQLDVSMDDIQIRFSQSMEGFEEALYGFASSTVVRQWIAGDDVGPTPLALAASYALGGREDQAWIHLVGTDGRLIASTAPVRIQVSDFQERLPAGAPDGLAVTTDWRLGGVVANMMLPLYDPDGTLSGWALLDVLGEQFVHYADPALVNEVCLYNSSTGMVSSLIHFDDYRALDDGWVFSNYDFSEGFHEEGGVLMCHKDLPHGFSLIGYLDISPYMTSLNNFYRLSVAVIVSAAIFSLITAFFLADSLVRPLKAMINAMGEVEKGDLAVRVGTDGVIELSELADKFNEMLGKIKELMMKNEEEAEKVREAERKALEAQMKPHFLFNTLNVIRSMARMHHEDQIEDITIKLGRLLRYAVDNHESTETLSNSFLMVDSYLGIQRVRYGEKLSARLLLEDGLGDVITPKLLIQPLVENALNHGLEPKLGEWELSVEASYDASTDLVNLIVRDNGVGFDPSPWADPESFAQSPHTGMYNVYKRLMLYYGKKASFEVESIQGGGTCITLRFPKGIGG